MSFPHRLVTAEFADETMRKNSFENRLLEKKLDDIEKNAAKRKRIMTTEQLNYAMENLTLEDMSKFTTLTRKIVLSNLLPQVTRRETDPDPGRQENDNRRDESGDAARRVRGTKITHGYPDRRSWPRKLKLTRRFPTDLCFLPVIDAKDKRGEVKDFYPVRNRYKIPFSKQRVFKSFSLSEVENDLHREETKIGPKAERQLRQ